MTRIRCLTTNRALANAILLIALAPFVVSCATTPADNVGAEPDALVTLEIERGPLSLLLRELNNAHPTDFVLMNGLELARVGPYAFESTPPLKIVDQAVADTGTRRTETNGYHFVYSEGYGELLDVSLEGRLSAAADALRIDVAIGPDTPLYNALALIGHGIGYTLIADNAIAGSLCGETHLHDVSLDVALGALLRSARVTSGSFEVESTEDYTLLRSVANRPREALSTTKVDSATRAMLQREVTVALPKALSDSEHVQGVLGAASLREVLPTLSEQLGVEITAEQALLEFPVNPSIMKDVTIETALELLIQQWPVAEFGYRAAADEIRLVRLGRE